LNLLITGGAGFIGSHFVDLLLTDPKIMPNISKVVVLDKLSYAGEFRNLNLVEKNSKFVFIKGDICDFELLMNIENNFDWIVNFAAESHVDRSLENPRDFVMTNVTGTVNLLNFALKANVKHFLQVSTDEVYGTISSGSWDEKSKLDPRSPYSASKAAAELFCQAFFISHKLDVRITRSSNNFGPRQNLEKMVPKIIYSLDKKIPIPVYGSGENIRDWIYVRDHCIGLWQVMQRGKPGEIYNLGGGTEITNLELISKISQIQGSGVPKIEFIEDRKGHDFRYSLDFEKSSKELGYRPEGEFETDLKKTIDWFRQSKL
jgi:dTDP-glucose 4,6-dehydratase